MNKKEFAKQMLLLLNQFSAADEQTRKKVGRKVAEFFRKNEKLDNGKVALNDPDLQAVGFAAELSDYRKETFAEEDLFVAKKALEKVAKQK